MNTAKFSCSFLLLIGGGNWSEFSLSFSLLLYQEHYEEVRTQLMRKERMIVWFSNWDDQESHLGHVRVLSVFLHTQNVKYRNGP